jgi:hypothetical protein
MIHSPIPTQSPAKPIAKPAPKYKVVSIIMKYNKIKCYSDSCAILINIATKRGNTNACIDATNNHCAYKINGPIIGKPDAKTF